MSSASGSTATPVHDSRADALDRSSDVDVEPDAGDDVAIGATAATERGHNIHLVPARRDILGSHRGTAAR